MNRRDMLRSASITIEAVVGDPVINPAGPDGVIRGRYGFEMVATSPDGSRSVLARAVHPPIGEPGMVVGEWVS